jgi:hypothetical protein
VIRTLFLPMLANRLPSGDSAMEPKSLGQDFFSLQSAVSHIRAVLWLVVIKPVPSGRNAIERPPLARVFTSAWVRALYTLN